MPDTLADRLAGLELRPDFWRAFALGLLRRAERREPGASVVLARILRGILYSHGQVLGSQGEIVFVYPRKKWEGAFLEAYLQDLVDLERELSSLKIDRRKIQYDFEPFEFSLLYDVYHKLRILIMAMKQVTKRSGYRKAASNLWNVFGRFGRDIEKFRSLNACLTYVGKDPRRFWEATLLMGFFCFLREEVPMPPKEETGRHDLCLYGRSPRHRCSLYTGASLNEEGLEG